ncbi:gamma-glutamylcyclotransferase [Virgibacillus sediminis]|uniref:Gamma-glutamylcyclotransferase n=1 Tax=Virgibacillus sediminis TaxID=202260 RepID=A0ABV7A1X8_9BACI
MALFFVYGRHRRGEVLHDDLIGSKCVCLQSWISGELEDSKLGFPVRKKNTNSRIYGEVYDTASDKLDSIKNHFPSLEFRKDTAYNDHGKPMEVVVSEYKTENEDGTLKTIPFGDWRVYQYLTRKNLFYFAYGSCMDDERFKMAKVDKYFSAKSGKGLLKNHGFRFSRTSNDGGKADLIESAGEKVEGVVYKVPLEAIDYLYQREGVYSNAYRPAIIEVEMTSGKRVEAVTFIGIDKHEETPPTRKYAEEIIRGAEGILSERYIAKIQKRIDRLFS